MALIAPMVPMAPIAPIHSDSSDSSDSFRPRLREGQLLDQAGALSPLVDHEEDVADIYRDGAL